MYGKYLLTTLALAICLHSTQAISAQMATNAGEQTVPKQFTFRHAGVDLTGLDPRAEKVRVECTITNERDPNSLGVVGIATVEFPVTQHRTGGGTVHSGPFTLSLNVGDGVSRPSSNPNDVTKWMCSMSLKSGDVYLPTFVFGPCDEATNWACAKPGGGALIQEGRFE